MPDNDTIESFNALIVPEPDSASTAPVALVLDTGADYSYRFSIVAQKPEPEAHESLEAWTAGLPPEPLQSLPGSHNGPLLIAAVLLVLVLFSFNSLKGLLAFNFDELVNVRHGRDNVFDERPAGIVLLQGLLAVIYIVCTGFLLGAGIVSYVGDFTLFGTHALLLGIGLSVSYYLFDIVAYSAVGYTFTTDEGRREWLRGYNASISLLAVSLVIPAAVAAFYPAAMASMAYLGLGLFIIAKIAFILKGFRIFFDNLFSLLYFILYLCTLEIIPIILVYNCSVYLMF